MDAAHALVTLLNGLSIGLWLFMMAAGLTLVFSVMGVLNFAHASFYMLGAYAAATLASWLGFWGALLLAPLLVGAAGALFEATLLRRAYRGGHAAELLLTFGASYVILELVQLGWGRGPLTPSLPAALDRPLFTLVQACGEGLRLVSGDAAAACAAATCQPFGAFRAFGMAVAVAMLAALWVLLKRTRIGLVIRAGRTHPGMVQALGHDLPRLFTGVFAFGTALAALAGVIGGALRVTEPSMALQVGAVVFAVIVIGGMGSLAGAFIASVGLGVIESFAIGSDRSLVDLFAWAGVGVTPESFGHALWSVKLSQVASILPYLLLVLILIVRPRGLLGTREG